VGRGRAEAQGTKIAKLQCEKIAAVSREWEGFANKTAQGFYRVHVV